MLTRRSLLRSALTLVAAPAIVRVTSIMPVKPLVDWREELRGFLAFYRSLPPAWAYGLPGIGKSHFFFTEMEQATSDEIRAWSAWAGNV